MDLLEAQVWVCSLYGKGEKVADIVRLLRQRGLSINRWAVYKIIRQAREKQQFVYRPPLDLELAYSIQRRYDWLRLTTVVNSVDYDGVADRAGEAIWRMISNPQMRPKKAGEMHIGFAGGRLLELTARNLASRMTEAHAPRWGRLFLHALVASFGDDPAANPNSFLGYFTPRSNLPVDTRIIGLPAPGFVHADAANKLREIEGISEAFEQVARLDLIVTSAGGHWTAGCSYLHKLHKAKSDLDGLKAAGCLGDVMWRPIGRDGPIELRSGFRAMTLMDLSELPGLINDGTRVMLVLAPCGTCGHPKTDLLDTVLSLPTHHISDLTLDSSTARAILGKSSETGRS